MSIADCQAFMKELKAGPDPNTVHIAWRTTRLVDYNGHNVALYAYLKYANKHSRMSINLRAEKYITWLDKLADLGVGVTKDFQDISWTFQTRTASWEAQRVGGQGAFDGYSSEETIKG